MPTYRLIYFDLYARAELSRLIFKAAKVEFEDVRNFQFPSQTFKETIAPAFGQLPVLEVDGKQLVQSTTIARYLANQFGLAGANDWEKAQADSFVDFTCDVFEPTLVAILQASEEKCQAFVNDKGPKMFGYLEAIIAKSETEYLVSDKLTWADIAIIDMLHWLENHQMMPEGEYPSIRALQKKVQSVPQIAAHINTREPREH